MVEQVTIHHREPLIAVGHLHHRGVDARDAMAQVIVLCAREKAGIKTLMTATLMIARHVMQVVDAVYVMGKGISDN